MSIDSSGWNYLFEEGVDLCGELPIDKFFVSMPREIEIEIEAIPDFGADGSDKRPLKRYIRDSMERRQVKVTAVFGFAEALVPGEPSRVGNFGSGGFISDVEREWRARPQSRTQLAKGGKRPTGLSKNEADMAVAVASRSAIVLTGDAKAGPISDSMAEGGRVVLVRELRASGLSLRQYIEHHFGSSL